MSVQLNPGDKISFIRPFTHSVSSTFAITNPNAYPVAFKVKTTAPKQYCVRPNLGVIEPGGSSDVQVWLQAMREDPPINFKCKDKFLVQSMVLTPDRRPKSLSDMWVFGENEVAPHMHQQKIRVAYLPPKSPSVEEEPADGIVLAETEKAREENITPIPDVIVSSPSRQNTRTLPSPPPSPRLRPQESDIERSPSPARPDYIVTDEDEPVELESSRHEPEELTRIQEIPSVSASAPTHDVKFPEPSQRSADQAPINVRWLQRLLASLPPALTARLQRPNQATGLIVNEKSALVAAQDMVTQRPMGVPLQLIILILVFVFMAMYYLF